MLRDRRTESFRRFCYGRLLSTIFFFIWMYIFSINNNYSTDKIDNSHFTGTLTSNECYSKPSTSKFILKYQTNISYETLSDLSYPEPSIARIRQLLEIVRSKEDQYQPLLETFGVFSMLNPKETLRAYTEESNMREIQSLYLRFIELMPDKKSIVIDQKFIDYLKKISNYLSDGLRNRRSTHFRVSCLPKPVFVFACDSGYFNDLQNAIDTLDQYWYDHPIIFYDLGITNEQEKLLRAKCDRCTIIKFPFASIEKFALHVGTLRHYVYKPFVIQDALHRYGTIIYADTSMRFNSNSFTSVLADNYLRGFGVREIPRHSLSCYTRSGTFRWFNESHYHYDNVYMAKASVLVVTDTFLTRLIMKAWLTCALEVDCILAFSTESNCNGKKSGAHLYDHSAMVIILTHFFFQNKHTTLSDHQFHDPAPYDISTSMQTIFDDIERGVHVRNRLLRKKNRTKL